MLDEIGMSDKKIVTFFEEAKLQELLSAYLTKDIELTDEDYEEYYAQYLIDKDADIRTYNVNYIITDSLEKAEEAKARAEAGEDMFTLIKEYSVDYAEPDEGEENVREKPESAKNIANPLINDYFAAGKYDDFEKDFDTFLRNVYKLEEGEYSDIVTFLDVKEINTEEAENEGEADDTGEAGNEAAEENGEAADADGTDAEANEENEEAVENEEEIAEPAVEPRYVFVFVDNIEDKSADEEYKTVTVREIFEKEKKDELYTEKFQEIWKLYEEKVGEVNSAVYDRINVATLPEWKKN